MTPLDRSNLHPRKIVVLSGGVGGARFLHGLAQALPPSEASLTAIVNTGDDFEHWGLTICPDLDTVLYTLAGVANERRGWGLEDEAFRALEQVQRFGGESWFALGDRDLGTHLTRTQALARGEALTRVTAHLCQSLGVTTRVLPMTDAPCRTFIDTLEHGTLPFQRWFVQHRAPAVKRVWFEGATEPSTDVLAAISEAELVLIGPSNPYVSIDPILSLQGVRAALETRPMVAVSPLVQGRAIKGPLAEMMPVLSGWPASAAGIARHYGALLSGIVVHSGDSAGISGTSVHETDVVMHTVEDRARLALEVLAFASTLLPNGSRR